DLHELGSRIGGSRLSRITGGLGGEDDDVLDDFYDNGRCKWIPLAIRNAFSEMIDLELLKDSVMMLLCISNLLGMMGFYIPFVFLKDLAHSHGTEPSDRRVFFGWLADRGYVSALAINNFSLLACGVLTFIAPLLPSFTLQMAYAALFGFIIWLEKLTNSFGLLVVARGIASLAGSPFAGLVYDVTQSYSATFYFAGFVIIVSGLISCAIPLVHKWKRSHGDNEEIEEEKRRLKSVDKENKRNGTVEEVNEEDGGDEEAQKAKLEKAEN
ncbi:unnamed protein product, partial [Strongylus vulgaris]